MIEFGFIGALCHRLANNLREYGNRTGVALSQININNEQEHQGHGKESETYFWIM